MSGQFNSSPLGENVSVGVLLLSQAWVCAHDADAELWDFALEIDRLYEAGMTVNDLRWMVAKGYAEHGRETTYYTDNHRTFRPSDGFKFKPGTCLVLTLRGFEFASGMIESGSVLRSTKTNGPSSTERGMATACAGDDQTVPQVDGPAAALKPRWDPSRRELSVANAIVKRFRVPAPNQERILCAFEEENWPEHIDDPLPLSAEIDPRTRLHDAINRLNRHQTNTLVRFQGNGNGTGCRWELRDLK